MRSLLAALASLLVVGGVPAGAVTALGAITAAQPTLLRVPLTLVTAGGRKTYTVEVARSAQEQATGMMFRKTLGRRAGMFFPFDEARPLSFWMQNTYVPLDIVFIGADDRVLNVARGVPRSTDFVWSDGAAAAVLELNAGEAARIGLKRGDRAVYRLPG